MKCQDCEKELPLEQLKFLIVKAGTVPCAQMRLCKDCIKKIYEQF